MPTSLEAARRFHVDFYEGRSWNGPTHWLGYPVYKPPTDLWAVQQIIATCHPNVIIEAGSAYGGSALFYASVMDAMGIDGKVFSIDIADSAMHNPVYNFMQHRPAHPKLEFICSDSSDPEVTGLIDEAGETMVILDSDHHEAHVLEELELWSPLVTKGQYLIVEDTQLDRREWMGKEAGNYTGPGAALKKWLPTTDRFVVDHKVQPCLTFHPGGYLQCVR